MKYLKEETNAAYALFGVLGGLLFVVGDGMWQNIMNIN